MTPKRLVLLVEGEGDEAAAPRLVGRLLAEYSAHDAGFVDDKTFRIGEYSSVVKDNYDKWLRLLKAAVGRKDFGGCLLLLDGDSKRQDFCASRAARCLAAEARQVGAGKLFSVAVVFACKEFESWFIAGLGSLVGKPFSDNRIEIPSLPKTIPADPEIAPRNAKGWLAEIMRNRYSPTRDQKELAELLDFNLLREKNVRSFRRLESALKGLIGAIRSGQHVVTPE